MTLEAAVFPDMRSLAPHQRLLRLRRRRKTRSVFGLPMLRPEERAARVWALFVTAVDVTYTAFLVHRRPLAGKRHSRRRD